MRLDPEGQPTKRNKYHLKRLTNRTIDELIGVCKGILADKILHPDEIQFLIQWLTDNRDVIHTWPATILAQRIEKILIDGAVDENEKTDLFKTLQSFVKSTDELVNIKTGEIIVSTHSSTSLPLDTPMPTIEFKNKLFCFTGKFCYGPREKCETKVISLKGKIQPQPTTKTNYLVIGILGSRDWLHSAYGTKIEKAVEFKKKGHPLSIISEEHWAKYL